MTKVKGIETKIQQNPLGKACLPAGLEPAVQQPAAAETLSQVHVDTTDIRLWHGEVLGLQQNVFGTAMAEGAVYLDLCLIFLLFRFSLSKGRVLTEVIAKIDLTLRCSMWSSYLRMRFFRHCKTSSLIEITMYSFLRKS